MLSRRFIRYVSVNIYGRLNLEDSFADIFSRHKDRRISEMRQRWRDAKFKRKYRT